MHTIKDEIFNLKYVSEPRHLYYLETFLSSDSYVLIADLKSACTSTQYQFSQTFEDAIRFLKWIELIEVDNSNVKKLYDFSEFEIIRRVMIQLNLKNMLIDFIPSACMAAVDNNGIQLDNSRIPSKYSFLRNVLIKHNLFISADSNYRYLYVNPDYLGWFKNEVIKLLENGLPKFSLDRLKSLNARNDDFGELAEKYVLNYEQQKLRAHPRANAIKIISKDHVSAGFDIISFIGLDSVVLDKEIEVKSYSGLYPYFYWSKNELDRSIMSGDKYFLYLVNRDLYSNEDYEPLIYQNPYNTIFNNSDNTWKIAADTYYIEKSIA
jgi:hypothetical protein